MERKKEFQTNLQNVLKKTIVFITHDFDEAIRLADRIAIMQDGNIIQIGTPEALVLSPATNYVAEFTKDIPRAKVLTARAVMGPLGDTATLAGRVQSETKIEALAERFMDSDDDVAVTDRDGTPIGRLSRRVVMAVLLGGSANA